MIKADAGGLYYQALPEKAPKDFYSVAVPPLSHLRRAIEAEPDYPGAARPPTPTIFCTPPPHSVFCIFPGGVRRAVPESSPQWADRRECRKECRNLIPSSSLQTMAALRPSPVGFFRLPRKRKGKNMSDLSNAPQPTQIEPQRSFSGAFLTAVAVAVIAALAALVWSYVLNGRIARQETALADANQQNAKLAADLRETDARLRVATDELSRSLGLTQKQLEQRAQAIIRREDAANRQLQAAQQHTAQQVASVSSDVSNVKTDVGGVKTQVAKTQADLAQTISQLQSMRGDLTGANTLIARNHDELVALEHKGDRNYYEFTLDKNHRKPVGTVSMELRKADPKHSRFTLWIFADDRRYEKKNRNVNEPLQFYSGKQPELYEIVVNNIQSKGRVSGYLSTPKNAPVPAATGQ